MAVWAAMVLSAFGQSQITYGAAKKSVPRIAVPDFRNADVSPNLMYAFNQTLWNDLNTSGIFSMVHKSVYPKAAPQQPSDFRRPQPATMQRARGEEMLIPRTGGGLWMTDWSARPVNANFIVFGRIALQGGILVLYGNLFDLSRPDPNPASQPLSKQYLAATVDENGARQIAHEFAADILKVFGFRVSR